MKFKLRIITTAVLLAMMVSIAIPKQVEAAAYIVVNTGQDLTTKDPATCSLRMAIIASNRGRTMGGCIIPENNSGVDLIAIAPNISDVILSQPIPPPGENDWYGGDLNIEHSMMINGNPNGGTKIYIDLGTGSFFDRVFHVNVPGGQVTLRNLNISGGSSPDKGGGLYIESGTVSVSNSQFLSNFANITGGGVYISYGASLSVSQTVFQDNTSGGGGAIKNLGYLNAVGNYFYNNGTKGQESGAYGGAINNDIKSDKEISKAVLTNNTFFNNHALNGGAILNKGEMQIINSTFIMNTATDQNSPAAIIVNNPGKGFIVNSIILQKTDLSDTCYITASAFVSSGHNMEDRDGCHFNTSLGDKTKVDYNTVLMSTPETWGGLTKSFKLLSNSPAIGMAVNCPMTDQRGFLYQRPHAPGYCDAGAVEYDAQVIVLKTVMMPLMTH